MQKRVKRSCSRCSRSRSLWACLRAATAHTAPTRSTATPRARTLRSPTGVVVKKDEWYYFINGAEDYSADNTYGNAVKGSLMRISETDLAAGNYGETDIVVPQLIVAQDYTSGIYIYGDYVYYATPNTTRNMEGTIESATSISSAPDSTAARP